MTQILADTTAVEKFRPGLLVRVAILAAIFLADKIFLNLFVDFDAAERAQGLGAVLRVAQHWGFRFLVAFAAAITLFAYVRGGLPLKTIDTAARAAPIRVGLMLGHILCIAMLAPLCYLMYRYTATSLSLAAVITLLFVVGAAATLAAAVAMAPASVWRATANALGVIWWYAAVTALLSTGAMRLAQTLWAPTAALTFRLVRGLLRPILPTLTADPAALVLATNRFAVQIAEECSGLEGVSLMLAFSGAWLIYFRREYVFPRALLLVPIGVVAIFALNAIRIAALLWIGDAGFPEVAVYGFHSQAGWMAFIAVACGLVLLSRRSVWFGRTAAREGENPTATYLMPLLAILAAGAVSRAMSSDFEYFYALRVIVGVTVFAVYRRQLASLDWRCSWRGAAVGVAVFLLWIIAGHFLMPAAAMPAKLAALPLTPRLIWITGRIAGAVLVVPIAEELAYRGYLMRRLTNADFESVPYERVRWPALAVTAAAFGLAHGAMWLPGIAAGAAYGLVLVRRGRIGEAVAGHAVTNVLIAACVLGGNQWQLW